MKTRSLTGTIGATLLGGAALLAQPQNQTPTTPAPTAPASAVQPVSQSLGLIVYPAKGQSADRQSVDEQECYNWAKSQTGIDPQAQAAQAERQATFKKALGTRLHHGLSCNVLRESYVLGRVLYEGAVSTCCRHARIAAGAGG